MDAKVVPEGTIKRILEDENSPIRFEDFCCDLFTEVDGINYVGTSRSWDLARDGRTLPITTDGKCGYICCTIGTKLEEKAKSDLERMVKFARPERIYFCTSQLASELALSRIEDEIRDIAQGIERVAAIGSKQIVTLICRNLSPFNRRYAAELLEHADFLSHSTCSAHDEEVLGLQVALATQFDDNAQFLKTQLSRRLILKVLNGGNRLSVRSLAKAVSDLLCLPRIMHRDCFRDDLIKLVEDHLIDEHEGTYGVTPLGRESISNDNKTASSRLNDGRVVIKESLENLFGDQIDDDSFGRLWNYLLDELANIFFAQGLKLIQAISSLTRAGSLSAPKKSFAQLLDLMRERITKIGVGGARSDSIAQAVVDLFSERESPAFSWLTDVAVKYVSMCSLGLEPTAQQEITSRLKDIKLLLDTDIVLSYLSKGERPHLAITETIDRWKEIGGDVTIVPPVVDETAYHAWISEFEYQEVWRQLVNLEPNEFHRYVKTAFVRAFYIAAEGRFEPDRWRRFIAEYRGSNSRDTMKMVAILRDQGFIVPDDFKVDETFSSKVQKRIFELRRLETSEAVTKQVSDKIKRDGDIISHLKIKRGEQVSSHETTVVISSSPNLQKAASTFVTDLGDPSPVWPVGALSYLISLIPGVRLTLGVLRHCLFEEGEIDRMDRITEFAMRVIRQSQEYSIGYSQRPTLKRALRQQIDKAATERGQTPRVLADELYREKHKEKSPIALIIAEAIDTIQSSKSEREIDKLKNTIKDLTSD